MSLDPIIRRLCFHRFCYQKWLPFFLDPHQFIYVKKRLGVSGTLRGGSLEMLHFCSMQLMAIYDIDVSNKLMFCKDRETSYNFQEEK